MSKEMIEPGTTPAQAKFHITVEATGPYLVYGSPPLKQQFITTNEEGASWAFKEGAQYDMTAEPTALCRCGASKKKPYCDGTHLKTDWDPTLTAPVEPILANAEVFEGPALSLSDNEKYCAFARFCDASGRAWNLVEQSDNHTARSETIREANICPGARLSAWDNTTRQPFEPKFDPSLGLIEDPHIGVSGPLWVRGGIAIQRQDGVTYEIRNRVTLCRCGQSSNKPYCDGTHASSKFKDGLKGRP